MAVGRLQITELLLTTAFLAISHNGDEVKCSSMLVICDVHTRAWSGTNPLSCGSVRLWDSMDRFLMVAFPQKHINWSVCSLLLAKMAHCQWDLLWHCHCKMSGVASHFISDITVVDLTYLTHHVVIMSFVDVSVVGDQDIVAWQRPWQPQLHSGIFAAMFAGLMSYCCKDIESEVCPNPCQNMRFM